MSLTGDRAEELLTIPEAAAQIGISERTLYRLLKADNFAARTVTEHRQTVTGRRLTTLLPPDLVREIAESQPPPASSKPLEQNGAKAGEGETGGNGDNDAASVGANTGGDADNTGETVSNGVTGDAAPDEDEEPGTLPAVVYRTRIADLEAMNAELRADKERLYRLLEMAQANLAREQALRALPPPQAAVQEAAPHADERKAQEAEPPTEEVKEAPARETKARETAEEAPASDGPSAAQNGPQETQAATSPGTAEARPGGWWARLLGRA